VYAKYFGLRELPFNNTPDPRFFYPTPDHEEALATLLFAVGEGKGYVLLTGETGTGKTLISRLMLRHFDGRVAFATVNHAVESAHDLLHLVCAELEIDVRGDETTAQLIHTLQTFLLDRFAARVPVVLLLDEAQNLPRDAFELLRTIGNLESDDAKLLQVVILGQPELRARFQAADMRQLRQRLFRTFHLPALNRQQCGAYVRHRLHVAGAAAEVFDDSAIDSIHRHTGGLPRQINTLCDNALLSAYSADRTTIDGPFVESVVRQMMPIDGIEAALPGLHETTDPAPEPNPEANVEDHRYVRVLREDWEAVRGRLAHLDRTLAEQVDAQRSATSATASGLDDAATRLASLEQDLTALQEQAAQNAAAADATVRQVSHLQEYVGGSDLRHEEAVETLDAKAGALQERIEKLEHLAEVLQEVRRAAGNAFAQAARDAKPETSVAIEPTRPAMLVPVAPAALQSSPDERVGRLMQRIAATERQIDNIDAWMAGMIRRGDSQTKDIQELQGTADRARRLAAKAFDRATRAHGHLHRVESRMSDLADEIAALKASSDRTAAEQQSIRARLTAMTQSASRTRQAADEAGKEAARATEQSKRIGEDMDKLTRRIDARETPVAPAPVKPDPPRPPIRQDTNERLRRILERSRTCAGELRGTLDGPPAEEATPAGSTPVETLTRDVNRLASAIGA
jgi:type II secretory pathway predicted ATPase ExeA/predicted  nucleic acid-binding Zn-ribbon protein